MNEDGPVDGSNMGTRLSNLCLRNADHPILLHGSRQAPIQRVRPMLRVISWNMKHDPAHWAQVLDSGADVALLQEACAPPPALAPRIDAGPYPWITPGPERRPWRTAVVALTPRARLQQLTLEGICTTQAGGFGVSRPGTIAAAQAVDPDNGRSLMLVSMYSLWERPHAATGSGWIYADASAHRLISDISTLIGQQTAHRILAAGDLNCLHGHGEDGNQYWSNRYRTVFERMRAIGLDFIGPQHPNGRQANPWPAELPKDSLNVPTFHSNRQNPGTATRQLDFVFVSSLLKQSRPPPRPNPRRWHGRMHSSSDHGDP